jgi:hypothetical protein
MRYTYWVEIGKYSYCTSKPCYTTTDKKESADTIFISDSAVYNIDKTSLAAKGKKMPSETDK